MTSCTSHRFFVVFFVSIGLLGGCGASPKDLGTAADGFQMDSAPADEVGRPTEGRAQRSDPQREEPVETIDSAPRTPIESTNDAPLPAPAPRTANTHVGRFDGGQTLIGMVTDGEWLLAYVCDGDESMDSISQWFYGPIEDGAFALEAMSGSGYAADGDASGATLYGWFNEGAAAGYLAAGDWTQDWTAEPAIEESPAGLYVDASDESLTGLIVTNDGRFEGLTVFRASGSRSRVQLSGRALSGPIQTVQVVPSRGVRFEMEVTQLREPRPVAVPNPPKAQPAKSRVVQIKFAQTSKVRMRQPRGAGRPVPVALKGPALRSAEARELMGMAASWNWRPLHNVPEVMLDQLRQDILADTGMDAAEVPDLNNWFTFEVPEGQDVGDIVDTFRRLEEVQYASPMPGHVAPAADPPDMTTPGNPSGLYQQYLDDATQGGVDARYAWTIQGGTGSDVKVCTVEFDANRAHFELMDDEPVPLIGAQPVYEDQTVRDHGTAVLSIVGGRNDGLGITGIAYDAEVMLSPIATVATNGQENIPAAISRAALATEEGDVIVIEIQAEGPNFVTTSTQDGLVAMEWDFPSFEAIKTATAAGRIVVEAAGNGSTNLSLPVFTDPNRNQGHHPFEVDANGDPVEDSGAIIVGAGFSPLLADAAGNTFTRQHNVTSNYGRRIDVQAWGDSIAAAGRIGGNLQEYGTDQLTYSTFGGTSGATAMMAGVVASLQGVARQAWAEPMRAHEMRDLLKAASLPQERRADVAVASIVYPVGPLPNLRTAADAIQGRLPNPILTPAPPMGSPPITPVNPFTVRFNADGTLNDDYILIVYTTDGSEPDISAGIGYENGGNGWVISAGDEITLTEATRVRAKVCMPIRAFGGPFDSHYAESETVTVFYGLYIPAPTVNVSGGEYSGILFVTLTHELGEDYHFYEYANGIRKGWFAIIYTMDGTDPNPEVLNGGTSGSTQAFVMRDEVDYNAYIEVFTYGTPVTLKARTIVGLGFGMGSEEFAVGELLTQTYTQAD